MAGDTTPRTEAGLGQATYVSLAQQAAEAAETAQAGAETARDLSQTARLAAEAAQGASETAQAAAETAQAGAETAQGLAEAAQAAAESAATDAASTVLGLIPVRTDIDQNLSDAQKAQALKNISAVPVIAAAAPLVINVNPAGFISQESISSLISTSGYPGDGWLFSKSGIAGTCTAQRVAETGAPGLPYGMQMAAPIEVTGASDYVVLAQSIEGTRARRLGWNVAGGGVMTLAMLIRSNAAAIKSIFLRRGDNGVTFVYPVTLVNGLTFVTITIPVPTNNAAWADDTSKWGSLGLTVRAGSTYAAASAGAWVTGNYFAAPTHQNNDGVQENVSIVAAVMLPGIVPITQASLPYLMRTEGEELDLCMRYFQKSYGLTVAPGTVTTGGAWGGVAFSAYSMYDGNLRFMRAMRTSPTVTLFSTATGASGKMRDTSAGADVTGTGLTPSSFGFQLYSGSMTAGRYMQAHWTADARP